MASRLRKIIQSDRAVFALTSLVVFLLFVSKLGAYDLWWHLRAGEQILRQGAVPRSDPFSFTAQGQPWTYHSWLSGVLLFCVYRLGGFAGLILLRALLIAASLMLAWEAARRRGVPAALASVLVLACAYQMRPRALTRPYLFSFVLFMAFYLIIQHALQRGDGECEPEPEASGESPRPFLEEHRLLWGRHGRLLLLPALTVLWANLHAGFISGLLILGAFGAGEMVGLALERDWRGYLHALLREPKGARFRALLVAGALCLAASLATPYGPGTLLYPFKLLFGVRLVKEIQEWQRIPLSTDYAIFWTILALCVVALVRSVHGAAKRDELRGRSADFATDVLLAGGFGALAVSAVRNVSWFVLLAPAVLGHHVARVGASARPDRSCRDRAPAGRLYLYIFCVLAALLVVRHVTNREVFGFGVMRDRFPVQACDWLEEKGIGGRFYNTYEWGGYLIWRFWPVQKVFVDGRSLLYGDRIIESTLRVADGKEGWQSILERWRIEMLIIRYRERDSEHFFQSGNWHCIYWDDVCIVAVSDEKLGSLGGTVAPLALSNPAVFEQTVQNSSPQEILAELGRVLEERPGCWTAWTFRARCLLKLAEAEPENEGRLLPDALENAQKAVQINDGAYETWSVLEQCYRRAGRHQDADRAGRKARRLKDRDASAISRDAQ